jgi:hypothetical protein
MFDDLFELRSVTDGRLSIFVVVSKQFVLLVGYITLSVFLMSHLIGVEQFRRVPNWLSIINLTLGVLIVELRRAENLLLVFLNLFQQKLQDLLELIKLLLLILLHHLALFFQRSFDVRRNQSFSLFLETCDWVLRVLDRLLLDIILLKPHVLAEKILLVKSLVYLRMLEVRCDLQQLGLHLFLENGLTLSLVLLVRLLHLVLRVLLTQLIIVVVDDVLVVRSDIRLLQVHFLLLHSDLVGLLKVLLDPGC